MSTKPLVLLILDGFGHSDSIEHNAIAQAHAPIWQSLWKNHPHTLLEASGLAVGLPEGQMGNSEVGHLHLGSGRTLYQELTRIDHDIETGEFFKNLTLQNALTCNPGKAIHILTLLSPGGVHSHEKHTHALIQLAAQLQIKNLYIHAFLDGRDTPPQSAETSLIALENTCKHYGVGKIASLCGRYYAMDRDNRWDRTQQAYDLLTQNKTDYTADNALAGLHAAYARHENDEFVKPTHIKNTPAIDQNDTVIFMNFRSDRARQLTRAFTTHATPIKTVLQSSHFFTLTPYADDIPADIIYPAQSVKNTLGEVLAQHHLKQLRLAETEKYAHVTFFFNGGNETPFPNEERLLIPSPQVATYDLQPDMSAIALTDALIDAIDAQQYDVIIINYANPDMLGHTGDLHATTQAIETIDACLTRIISTLKKHEGALLITADHGNAECMFDENTQQKHTAHTTEPVPFVYVGSEPLQIAHLATRSLADVAPTVLYILGIPQPPEMTGHCLLEKIPKV